MRTIFIVIISMLLFACKAKLDTATQTQYDKVMEIHDEVMPKMSDIRKAKKSLKKLKTEDNASIVSAMTSRLDEAEEAMMSWMHDFSKPSGDDVQAAKQYLDAEMLKIEKVRSEMMGAINAAESMIKQLGANE